MLRNTFCHIPGVSLARERKLWSLGIESWDQVAGLGGPGVSARTRELVSWYIGQSQQQLAARQARYFCDLLPADQTWRLFPEFRGSVAYLDIETTGLSPPNDHVTTIAFYDGRSIRTYVRGRNLEEFARDIRGYDLLVTYNGRCFDLPFLRRALGVDLEQAHIDLRYVLRSLGYRGGLKGCERQLGIDRGELEGVDGYFAVLLWQDYLDGNAEALETLLAYNIEDVVNLETLMVLAYNLKLGQTPFAARGGLERPASPAIPSHAHLPTIRRLMERMGGPEW